MTKGRLYHRCLRKYRMRHRPMQMMFKELHNNLTTGLFANDPDVEIIELDGWNVTMIDDYGSINK